MPRVKLTQEQEELIAVFPLAITKSDTFKRLSNAQKLVLAQIDLQDGTDFSEENCYSFASNKDLMDKTGILSEHTVINAVKTLVNEGLIETRRGRRDKNGSMASEYVLTNKYYGLCDRENPHKKLLQYMDCNKNNQGCNKGCNNNTAINPTVEAMQQEINELKKIINELQNQLQKSYCSTESESDVHSDTCISENVNKKKKYNSNINCNTVPVDNTDDVCFKEKKKNIKRKKEICECHTDSDGTVGDENNFSNFTDMEENTIQRQGEQGSNSKSYYDVINAVVNRINKGQSFSENGLKDYIFEQFISKGTVTQQQWDSDLFLLQKMKESHGDVTEDTVTPTEKNDNATEHTVTPSVSKTDRQDKISSTSSTPKWSYGDVYWQVRKKIEMGKGFSEQKVRDYVTKHFILTGKVSQREFESDLLQLQGLKDSQCEAASDTDTPTENENELNNFNDMKESGTLGDDSHPSSWQGDSPNPNLSAVSLPHNDNGCVTEDDIFSALTSEPFVPYGVTAEA